MKRSDEEIIFVELPDEAVVVWRPVYARRLAENRYRILEQSYDRDIERWAFEPGDVVICEVIRTDDGEILAARSRA